MLLYTY